MFQLDKILRVWGHEVSEDGQEKGTCAWATCRDQADVFGQEIAPVFADELNTVVDEDQGDFAELCLLFRV